MGFLPWLGKDKQQEEEQKETEQESKPEEVSVFEFGPSVPVGGSVLKGMCIGENPDAIQACAWTVAKSQDKKKLKYHVEF